MEGAETVACKITQDLVRDPEDVCSAGSWWPRLWRAVVSLKSIALVALSTFGAFVAVER